MFIRNIVIYSLNIHKITKKISTFIHNNLYILFIHTYNIEVEKIILTNLKFTQKFTALSQISFIKFSKQI